MFIINVTKNFTCGENFNKFFFFFFFSGSVFENNFFFQVQSLKILFFSGSVFENKIIKQISNHENIKQQTH